MTSTAELFAAALARHQAGQLAEAVQLYERVLAAEPDHADSLHLLGVAAHQSGRSDQAVALVEAAIMRSPGAAAYRNNLGCIWADLGHAEPAIAAYRAALELDPRYVDAHVNLAELYVRLARREVAEHHYRLALAQVPNQPAAWLKLSVLQAERGDLAEALASVDEARRHAPGHAEPRLQRGIILYGMGCLAEAEAAFRAAAAAAPGLALAHSNLGLVLNDLGRNEEAEGACRRAIELAPSYAGAAINLGIALNGQGRFQEAEESFRAALALQPGSPAALANLGGAMLALGRPQEAASSARQAVAREADNAEAHVVLAMALLASGEFAEGWREYEWRWRAKGWSDTPRLFPQPLWDGASAPGRRVLIHVEQGLGDTLQFCRYIPLAARRARIVFEVPGPLHRLMTTLADVETLVVAGDVLPDFDYHCPLMSLPHILGAGSETLSAAIPYLSALPGAAASWRRRRATVPGLWVGLVWAGAPRPSQPLANQIDRRRSLALAQLAPLAGLLGVVLVSLQKGEAARQLADPPPGLSIIDWTDELHDLADTAALIQALDLVVSVDTSVAHLAGALGKPVWLLNRFDSCWRWLTEREDSPWYPSLRQLRQKRPGDWAEVIARLRAALEDQAR
jgi:tetratricopeptide (TPR) repeat protein